MSSCHCLHFKRRYASTPEISSSLKTLVPGWTHLCVGLHSTCRKQANTRHSGFVTEITLRSLPRYRFFFGIVFQTGHPHLTSSKSNQVNTLSLAANIVFLERHLYVLIDPIKGAGLVHSKITLYNYAMIYLKNVALWTATSWENVSLWRTNIII